jgi:hypothetical protein
MIARQDAESAALRGQGLTLKRIVARGLSGNRIVERGKNYAATSNWDQAVETWSLGHSVRQSADAPQHSLRYVHLRRLADVVNVHLSPVAAGNPKNMTVRRSHFEDPVLGSQDFRGIVNFYATVRHIDYHCSP